jgi:hypothetical protein
VAKGINKYRRQDGVAQFRELNPSTVAAARGARCQPVQRQPSGPSLSSSVPKVDRRRWALAGLHAADPRPGRVRRRRWDPLPVS